MKIVLYIDVVFCVVLLPVMTMLLPVDRWLSTHPSFVILMIFWLYAVYFINRKVVMPMFFNGTKWWWPVLIGLSMVVVTYFLSVYDLRPEHGEHFRAFPPDGRMPDRLHSARPFFKMKLHQQGAWFLFFVVYAFSVAVGMLTQLFRQSMEKKEIEMEKNKAELALYKAQINPHFMFNTLNTLYGLMITGSDKAEPAFNQFISMVKYLYSNATRDFVPLEEEKEYISQYIELQKARLNEHTKVSFEYEHDGAEHRIAPMLLITFVENAFKYGVSSHADVKINIRLSAASGLISFTVENALLPDTGVRKGDGIGIENCRKRLELLYPGEHELRISQSEERYYVELKISTK